MKVKLLRKLNKLISIYYHPGEGIYKMYASSPIEELCEQSKDLDYLKGRRRRALLNYARGNYLIYSKQIKVM